MDEVQVIPEVSFGVGSTIDPTVDPAAANAVAEMARKAESGEDEKKTISLIPDFPDGTVTLTAGLIGDDGHLHRDAIVREMTGADEEALARVASSDQFFVHYVDMLISRCTVSIGGNKPTKLDLDSLLVGDRDMLALHIRRVTYGNYIHLDPLKCPECKHQFGVNYNLVDDVPMRPFQYGAQREFDIPLSRGVKAVVRLVDGEIQKSSFSGTKDNTTMEEDNTFVISRCLVSLDTGNGADTTVGNNTAIARELPSRDRKKILKFLLSEQPGPRYQDVMQECPKCERSFPLVIDYGILFFSED